MRKTYVKNAASDRFTTPINVIITVNDGGATISPITRPIIPVAKNIIISTLTLVGEIYLNTGILRAGIIKFELSLQIPERGNLCYL